VDGAGAVLVRKEEPWFMLMTCPWGKWLRGLLGLGVLGVTIFPSVMASAEDDLKDSTSTPKKCKDPTYKRLREDFSNKCKKPENRPMTCYSTDICAALEDKVRRFRDCIVARQALVDQCFGGGDDGHKEQVEGLETGLKNCKDMLDECRKKEKKQCPE
jgi:hypothetical protein